jgi:hypothetical protein
LFLASTRVYILAKELGVKSSAIVKKCQDEGLDVKNHMSVIKAGLAATIHEWFSEGENITTVETSQKVDLAKVRVKKKKKKAKAKAEAPETVEAVATVAEAEPEQAEEITTEEIVAPPEPTVAVEEGAPAEPIAVPEEPRLEPEPEPKPKPKAKPKAKRKPKAKPEPEPEP